MEVNGNTKRKYEKPMPVTDESWWESVLAEEKRYAASTRQVQHASPKPAPAISKKQKVIPPAPVEVNADWDQVKTLYRDDQILSVNVIGHNRGGLLVEADGKLAGFIPFSHLVGLAGKGEFSDRNIGLESYEGKALNVKIIECAPEEGRIVFSERAALSEPGKRSELSSISR